MTVRGLYYGLLWVFFSTAVFSKPENSYVVETSIIKPMENLAIERRYIGTIRAEQFSLLSPKSAGTVASIHVKPQEKVKKGQLLVSLKSGVEKRSLELAEKNLQSLKKELELNKVLFESRDITEPEYKRLEREVLAAQSKIEDVKRSLENVEIRAPFDGIVGVPRVSLGETVQPATTIISIMAGSYSIYFNVPASRLSELKVGQPLRMRTEQASINAIEMSIDPITRVGFAKAIFSSCEGCIVGESAFVHVTVYDKKDALVLPKKALFYHNQKPHVVLVVTQDNKKKAHIQEVGIGQEVLGQVEIINGIKAGDEVVIANPKRIQEDAIVTVRK